MNSKYIHTESIYISNESWLHLSKTTIPDFDIERVSNIEFQLSNTTRFNIGKIWSNKLRIIHIQDHGERHLIKIESMPPRISPIYFWLFGLFATLSYLFISELNNKLGVFALVTFFLIAVITYTQRRVISTKSLISKFKAKFA